MISLLTILSSVLLPAREPFALEQLLYATTADLLWTSFSGLSDIEFGLAGFPPTGVPTQG